MEIENFQTVVIALSSNIIFIQSDFSRSLGVEQKYNFFHPTQ